MEDEAISEAYVEQFLGDIFPELGGIPRVPGNTAGTGQHIEEVDLTFGTRNGGGAEAGNHKLSRIIFQVIYPFKQLLFYRLL